MDHHRKYLDMLAEIATTIEPVANARMSAALVARREILSIGINKKKSHPMQKIFGKNSDSIFLHAEIDAIAKAQRIDPESIPNSVLYISRVRWLDSARSRLIWGKSRPCLGCMGAIRHFGISEVVYTEDDCIYSIWAPKIEKGASPD
jgi:deoxycytidylate deaminase